MAPNKLAVTLTRFSHKIFVTVTYSFSEWVLIVLLLANSFYSYMITKFARYFGLKQPCILCSRVEHLLDPTKSTTDFYKTLVCENHATEISKLGYCSNHQRFTKTQQMCEECVSSSKLKNASLDQTPTCFCCEKELLFPFRESLLIKEIEEEKDEVIGCKVADVRNHSSSECEPQILSDVGSFYLRETAEEDSNEEDEVNDHAAIGKKSVIDSSVHGSVMDGKIKANHYMFSTINQLKSDFEAEQNARNELYAELEAERNAAAIAANQTMAMITRLQEEKAAMQMEALHYQRVMEEQAEYDQEALQLLNELVGKREKEKQDLEKELDVYRERISEFEKKGKAMMLVHKCTGNNNFSSSCSIDNDSDVLSIDLNCHYYEKVEESDLSLMDCSKQWGEIEDSLEELEEERLSIMKQLKELEEKLEKAEKQEEKQMEDNVQEEQEKIDLEPDSKVCNQEVNLVSSSFSTNITSENHPKTMASVARKLLDLVESDDDEVGDEGKTNEGGGTTDLTIAQVESEGKSAAVHKEMDHVYGRLQALEADTEFLRHCIGSVNKGNEGLNMLQEILQHLRELRDAEICL